MVLKPSGWDQIIMLLLIGIIAVPSCIIIGLRYGTIDYYIWIALAILIALPIVSLIAFKMKTYLDESYDTITFNNKGILFENYRKNIVESFPWEKVEGIILKKSDEENDSSKEIEILLSESIRTVKLNIYSSITTTEEQLYRRIMDFFKMNEVSLLVLD